MSTSMPMPMSAPRSEKYLSVAYLLWFFLGFFGLHKFYLGQPVAGSLYAVGFLIGLATAGSIGMYLIGLMLVAWVLDFILIPLRAGRLNAGR